MSLQKSAELDISDRIGQTLNGSCLLSMHGVLKRVIYSESVNKMLQNGIESYLFIMYINFPHYSLAG